MGTHPIGAFGALDALVLELAHQWPDLRAITLIGFSAGAQMLQHSIGFAAAPPPGISLRYVIADPGTWLYFDPVRPTPYRLGQAADWESCSNDGFPGDCIFVFQRPSAPEACPAYDTWKYGTQSLPDGLGTQAAQARSRYVKAHVDFLEGALDSSAAKGTFYSILDKSCAAELQGPFRLQRGVAYAAYEKVILKPSRLRRMVTVPGCAHDVACVLPSPAARPILFEP